jgi:MerR family Zn(II)-responsive transcriptional regulator of zntA
MIGGLYLKYSHLKQIYNTKMFPNSGARCEDKKMMTASILAKRANVPLFTVRYYTKIGLLHPSRDIKNGYRRYRQADKDRLTFISSAKNLGFTLAEIEDIFRHADDGDSPCPIVRDVIEHRINENREKIRELKRLQARIEKALALWTNMENSQPNGHSVCRLIESFAEVEARA